MDMPELFNYVKAPNYTGQESTKNFRKELKKATISTSNTIETFQFTSKKIADHAWPFEKQYLEQLEKEDSSKKYISLEERAKRRQRRERNRRGKNSRKIHNKKRKLMKIGKVIELRKNEISQIINKIEKEEIGKEETPVYNLEEMNKLEKHRNKFPTEYDISSSSSDEDDWIIVQ